jgi:hypothetical protein
MAAAVTGETPMSPETTRLDLVEIPVFARMA